MRYRPEIDGLRCLAVVSVVLFHAGIAQFSGGFVGVDVFFVISGYLITTIIMADMRRGEFSLSHFYERRARRILPALFFVVVTAIPAAWLILMPSDMLQFSKSLLSVVTFTSNFFFAAHSAYFDIAAELNPLLHTWSLAVEEQFYIVFPLLLMAIWRFGVRPLLLLTVLIFIVSFGYAIWASEFSPDMGFYSPWSRAWQLLLGAVLAVRILTRQSPPDCGSRANALSLVGITLIAMSVFWLDRFSPYPGWRALLPAFGAALIILYANEGTVSARLLSQPILVGIGLISYSLYLWHQPIFAFARYLSATEPPLWSMLLLAMLSALLALLTWYFVENKFRSGRNIDGKQLVASVLSVGAMLVGFSMAGQYTNGFTSRFDIAVLPAPWEGLDCHGKARLDELEAPLDHCLAASGNGMAGDFYLLGDSHAAQLVFPLQALSSSRDRELYFINTELRGEFPYSYWRDPLVDFHRVIERVLSNIDVGDVVVVAFHRGRLNALRDKHIPTDSEVPVNSKEKIFLANMRLLLPEFIARGVSVYLVLDSPLLAEGARLERCAMHREIGLASRCAIDRFQDMHTRIRQQRAFERLAEEFANVEVLDIMPVLYAGKSYFSPVTEQGDYKMFDRHHLTSQTALTLLPYLADSIPPAVVNEPL